MNENRTSKREKVHAKFCLLGCLGLPLLIVISGFAVYKINNMDPDISIPTHGVPADNARDYFSRAHATAKLMKHLSPYEMSGTPAQNNTIANYKACAADAEPALKQLREGLKHPLMEPPARSFHAIFPEYAGFRSLERVDVGAADYYAITGDPYRAMNMRLDGLEMAEMIPHGGVMITELVGIACEAIAESRMEPLIPQLNASQLQHSAERLETIKAKKSPHSDTLREEGYIQTAGMLEALKEANVKGVDPFEELVGGYSTSDDPNFSDRIKQQALKLQFKFMNKRSAVKQNLKYMLALANESDHTYSGKSSIPVPNNLITEYLGPVFTQSRVKYESSVAQLDLLRIEVALYRYKSDHGGFPTNLSELAPGYLPGIPADVMGGGPLHYVANGAIGFRLYSIGPDLKDNGGIPGKNPSDIPGDIVAGRMWTKKPILYTGSK